MGLSTLFANLTAATGQELDTNFAEVGALTTLQCSATGTNALVLTPAANQPAISAYGLPNPVKFGFTAAATSTGAVTLEVNSLGFLPVYTPNGVQATVNTLASGTYYEVTYTTGTSYNSGNGAWVLSSYVSAAGVTPAANASVSGLKVINNAVTPNTKIDISFSQASLVTSIGSPAFLGSLSATIDLTTGTVTSTANGMDGESRPASGFVYVYAISTGTGMSGLGTTVSPLSGAPTLPAGFTFYAYLGAMYCDGSSNLKRTRQLGIDTQYTVVAASNTATWPVLAGNGSTVGTYSNTSPTLASTSVSAFAPPTTSLIKVLANVVTSSAQIVVAPSAAYSGTNNGPIGSNGLRPPLWLNGFNLVMQTDILLESANLFIASDTSNSAIYVVGWADYVSAAA